MSEARKLVGGSADKVIPDAAITTSSCYKNDAEHGYGQMWRSRLDNTDTPWCAGAGDTAAWIQWDFGSEKVVTKVQTKGRHCEHAWGAQWVEKYRLSYSKDGISWVDFRDGEELPANSDQDSLAENELDPPLMARYVKLHPVQKHGHISMRAEFYGHGTETTCHPMLYSLMTDIFKAMDANGDDHLDDEEGVRAQMITASRSREEAEVAWEESKKENGFTTPVSKEQWLTHFSKKAAALTQGSEQYALFVIGMELVHSGLKAGVMGKEQTQMTSSQVLVVFQSYDVNGDGKITLPELKEVLQSLNPTFTDESVKELFRGADRDGDGVITVEEFLDWVFASTPDISAQRAHAVSKLEAAEDLDGARAALAEWHSLMKPGLMGSFNTQVYTCNVLLQILPSLIKEVEKNVDAMLAKLSGDTDDFQKVHADMFYLADADGDGVLGGDEGQVLALAEGKSDEEALAFWGDLKNLMIAASGGGTVICNLECYSNALQTILDSGGEAAKMEYLEVLKKLKEYKVEQITESFNIIVEMLFTIQSHLGISLGQSGYSFQKCAEHAAAALVIFGMKAGLKHAKYSLIQARKLGISNEYYEKMTKEIEKLMPAGLFAGVQVPSYWDFFAMEGIDASGGLTLSEGDDKNLFAKFDLAEGELKAFQQLFDVSFRKVYTRDRKGGAVPDRLRVVKGQRVQNLHNWAEYKARQKQIASDISRLKEKGTTVNIRVCYELKTAFQLEDMGLDLDENANSCWLFHGTNATAADCISRGDFLINLAGSNAGTLYGRGVYLAESCSKSDEYSQEDSEGNRCILVCRATLGNVLYNDKRRPPVDWLVNQCIRGPYHSVLGDREKCRGTFKEIIVYDDDQVYPEFIIFYKREYK